MAQPLASSLGTVIAKFPQNTQTTQQGFSSSTVGEHKQNLMHSVIITAPKEAGFLTTEPRLEPGVVTPSSSPSLPVVIPEALTAPQVSATLRQLCSNLPSGIQSQLECQHSLDMAPELSPEDQKSLTVIQMYVERVVAPSGTAGIARRLAALMSHYKPDFSPEGMSEAAARRMMADKARVKEDWLEALAEYPDWVLAEASMRWLKGPKAAFKPAIGQITGLCQEVMSPLLNARWQAQSLVRKQQAKNRMDAYAEEQRQAMWGKLNEQTERAGKRRNAGRSKETG